MLLEGALVVLAASTHCSVGPCTICISMSSCVCGTAGIKIYNGLEFAPAGPGNDIAEDNEDIRTIIEKFDKYIIGETNETYEST